MIVHFAAATPTFEERIGLYREIIGAIEELGHVSTFQLEKDLPTRIEMGLGMLDDEGWKLICKRELAELKSCDLAIFDVTNKATFGVGYQTAVAIANGKPTLLLQKEDSLEGSFVNGLEHPLIVRGVFTGHNLRDLITTFLKSRG